MAASQCAVLRCRPEDWAAARQPCLGTKTVQILQAQPGTLQALQQVAITLIPVLPSFLPLPWPHKVYCMWTQVFSVVSVFFHPTRVYVRPHTWKRNYQFYISLEIVSRHNKLNSLQPSPEKFCWSKKFLWSKELLERTKSNLLLVSVSIHTFRENRYKSISSEHRQIRLGCVIFKSKIKSWIHCQVLLNTLESVRSSSSGRRLHETTTGSCRIIKTCHSGQGLPQGFWGFKNHFNSKTLIFTSFW